MFRLLLNIIFSVAPIGILMLALHFIELQDKNISQLLLAERKQRTISAIKDVTQRSLIATLARQKRGAPPKDIEPSVAIEIALSKIKNDPEYDAEIVRTFTSRA